MSAPFVTDPCIVCEPQKSKLCPMQYYPQGSETAPWRTGSLHYLTRFNAIIGISFFGITTNFWVAIYAINYLWQFIFLFLLIVVLLLAIRHYNYQRWKLSNYFHDLTHVLRELTADAHVLTRSNSNSGYKVLMLYCDRFADIIGDYFYVLTEHVWELHNHERIRCVIRLTSTDNDGNASGLVFKTVGRSKSHNPSSKRVSTPLQSDTGIFKLLASKNNQGVFICDNVPLAVAYNYYQEGVDIKRSRNKPTSFMIAPINGYINGRVNIIGTITINTVMGKNIFKKSHVDILRAMADLFGAVLPSVSKTLFNLDSEALLPQISDE